MIWAGEIGDVTEVHAWTDRPHLAAGPDGDPGAGGPSRHASDWDLWLGYRRVAAYTSGEQMTPPILGNSTSPSTGAAFMISDAARWATWPATSSVRPIWRYGSGRLPSVECIKKEGTSRFHVPEEIDHPFRFSGARRSMPPVKTFLVRRHDRSARIAESRRGTAGRPAVITRFAEDGGTTPATGRELPVSRERCSTGPCLRLGPPAGDPPIPRPTVFPRPTAALFSAKRHDYDGHLRRADAPASGGKNARLQIPGEAI